MKNEAFLVLCLIGIGSTIVNARTTSRQKGIIETLCYSIRAGVHRQNDTDINVTIWYDNTTIGSVPSSLFPVRFHLKLFTMTQEQLEDPIKLTTMYLTRRKGRRSTVYYNTLNNTSYKFIITPECDDRHVDPCESCSPIQFLLPPPKKEQKQEIKHGQDTIHRQNTTPTQEIAEGIGDSERHKSETWILLSTICIPVIVILIIIIILAIVWKCKSAKDSNEAISMPERRNMAEQTLLAHSRV